MKLVYQKHSKGCGIAAVAMITGRSYDEVAKELFGTHGKVWGMYRGDVVKLLAASGWVGTSEVYPHGKPDRELACKPFAEVHLCEVRVFQDSEQDHFVIMDANGNLFDPMFGKTIWYRYSDLPHCITGFNRRVVDSRRPYEPPPPGEGVPLSGGIRIPVTGLWETLEESTITEGLHTNAWRKVVARAGYRFNFTGIVGEWIDVVPKWHRPGGVYCTRLGPCIPAEDVDAFNESHKTITAASILAP